MNRLTIRQFKELLLIGALEKGIYTNELELPQMLKNSQHCSLAMRMVRALKRHGPKDINYDHLEMAVLLQGVGHHVLYTCLQPSLRTVFDETESDPEMSISDVVYSTLDEELFKSIIYSLHPVASAMLAKNWHFPKEVIDVVLTHHSYPVKDVSPLCAWVKLINIFVDLDFPNMSKQDIDEFLSAYPQIKLHRDVLSPVFVQLNQDKTRFIEKSSTLAADAGRDVANYFKRKTQQMNEKRPPSSVSPAGLRPDLFSDIAFHKSVAISSLVLFEEFETEWFSPERPENELPEKMNDFLYRMKLFYLRRAYAKKQDLQAIASDYGVTEAEIKDLLKIQ